MIIYDDLWLSVIIYGYNILIEIIGQLITDKNGDYLWVSMSIYGVS